MCIVLCAVVLCLCGTGQLVGRQMPACPSLGFAVCCANCVCLCGAGQLVGRQMLASPSLGDIQLSMCDRKGNLEVEVIRARDLQARPGSRVLPGGRGSRRRPRTRRDVDCGAIYTHRSRLNAVSYMARCDYFGLAL